MQNSLPIAPSQGDILAAMTSPSSAPTEITAKSDNTSKKEEPKKSLVEEYVDALPEGDRQLYMAIRKDMDTKQKLSILLVTGELSYMYNLKGLPIEFKLLDGKEKYDVDQYQYGKDPLGLFTDDDARDIAQRMKLYDEDHKEAAIAFLQQQSIDAVTKRTTLVTLAFAIASFNNKKLGDVKTSVAKIEKFQTPIIQKLAQIYNTFETVVVHMLQDDDLLKK